MEGDVDRWSFGKREGKNGRRKKNSLATVSVLQAILAVPRPTKATLALDDSPSNLLISSSHKRSLAPQPYSKDSSPMAHTEPPHYRPAAYLQRAVEVASSVRGKAAAGERIQADRHGLSRRRGSRWNGREAGVRDVRDVSDWSGVKTKESAPRLSQRRRGYFG